MQTPDRTRARRQLRRRAPARSAGGGRRRRVGLHGQRRAGRGYRLRRPDRRRLYRSGHLRCAGRVPAATCAGGQPLRRHRRAVQARRSLRRRRRSTPSATWSTAATTGSAYRTSSRPGCRAAARPRQPGDSRYAVRRHDAARLLGARYERAGWGVRPTRRCPRPIQARAERARRARPAKTHRQGAEPRTAARPGGIREWRAPDPTDARERGEPRGARTAGA